MCVCVVGGGADSLSSLVSPSLLCVGHLRQFIHSHNISLSLMPLDLRLPDMRTKCVCVCVCVCVCTEEYCCDESVNGRLAALMDVCPQG